MQQRSLQMRLQPEKVAYWYFRLNGFFQIENFVVHPKKRGGQRTDADLLGVRFPHRAERLFDDPNDIMADDERTLSLCQHLVDVVIAEVKTGNCALNGPWTRAEAQNVHRVLAAIGCVPRHSLEGVAADIYSQGISLRQKGVRIRLIAVGRNQSSEITEKFPGVTQVIWRDMLKFIWDRFHRYRNQKTQVDQWDDQAKKMKRLAARCDDFASFVEEALPRIW